MHFAQLQRSVRVSGYVRTVIVVVVAFFSCDERSLSGSVVVRSPRPTDSDSELLVSDPTPSDYSIPTATLLTAFNALPTKLIPKMTFTDFVSFDDAWVHVFPFRIP